MSPQSGRSVCVIGAQGALGSVVVEQFRQAGWKVHPAGRRTSAEPGVRKLDLDRPETVAAAIADVDMVLSAVAHPECSAEQLVLRQGGMLVNCAHTPAHAAAMIAAQTSEPKGIVLLNAGLVPGIANLVAAELLQAHPGADCLEVAFTAIGKATAGKDGGRFIHESLASRPHHRVIELPMPQPFGRLKCIGIAEHDDGGFGNVAQTRRIDRYLGFGERPLRTTLLALNALHVMHVLPELAFTFGRGRPSKPSTEPTAIWVGARSASELLGATVIECEGDYLTTAAAARMFGERLAELDRPGCFHVEDVFTLDGLSASLRDLGVRWRSHPAL